MDDLKQHTHMKLIQYKHHPHWFQMCFSALIFAHNLYELKEKLGNMFCVSPLSPEKRSSSSSHKHVHLYT